MGSGSIMETNQREVARGGLVGAVARWRRTSKARNMANPKVSGSFFEVE